MMIASKHKVLNNEMFLFYLHLYTNDLSFFGVYPYIFMELRSLEPVVINNSTQQNVYNLNFF